MSCDELVHVPVLLDEVLCALECRRGTVFVDCTFGRGGHTRALLERLGRDARVLAIDRDPQAIAAGRALAQRDARLMLAHAPFSELRRECATAGIAGRVDGVLFDLGVSSAQLDDAGRGFSFRADGPLDMRMNPDEDVSAARWLSTVRQADLAEVLRTYGEERYARRIARAIVEERRGEAITTTRRLAEIVTRASPSREHHKHPATRTFQAIRIAVNGELDELERALPAAVSVLAPGGRLVVISFHSLEDRLVKRFFRRSAHPRQGLRPDLSAAATLGRVAKPVRPGAGEVENNPRARSAVLRVAQRVP